LGRLGVPPTPMATPPPPSSQRSVTPPRAVPSSYSSSSRPSHRPPSSGPSRPLQPFPLLPRLPPLAVPPPLLAPLRSPVPLLLPLPWVRRMVRSSSAPWASISLLPWSPGTPRRCSGRVSARGARTCRTAAPGQSRNVSSVLLGTPAKGLGIGCVSFSQSLIISRRV
jgi:hypothetical protein